MNNLGQPAQPFEYGMSYRIGSFHCGTSGVKFGVVIFRFLNWFVVKTSSVV